MVWEVANRRGNLPEGPKVNGCWSTFEDMNLVAGWLLWSHRMASRFGRQPANAFAAAAHERGITLSPTEISRAEKGEAKVTVGAIAKYERTLDLPSGTLSAPLRSAARLVPDSPGADKLAQLRTVPKAADERQQVVNDFYQRYVDGDRFTGGEWLALADAITYDEHSMLPDPLAAQWIRTLLDEYMRGVNPAYFARSEAVSTIAEHDHYAEHLLNATRELTAAPGASGTSDAWSVLGDIRRPDLIDDMVAKLLRVPDQELISYAITLSAPANRHELTPEHEQVIATELMRRMSSWSLRSYEPIATLAAELPEALGGPILRRIDKDIHPMSRLTGHRADRDVTAEVSTYTQRALAATWPDHPSGSVLPELLRLVLSSERFGLRHHAATLIYCSPFAAAICDTAADLSMDSDDPPTRQLATYLMSRLATPDNDERLRLLLKSSDRIGLTINTLMAMAHAGVLTDQDDLTPFMRDRTTRYTGIYAAGITHHPDLYSEDANGHWATWWREKRGGIWE